MRIPPQNQKKNEVRTLLASSEESAAAEGSVAAGGEFTESGPAVICTVVSSVFVDTIITSSPKRENINPADRKKP